MVILLPHNNIIPFQGTLLREYFPVIFVRYLVNETQAVQTKESEVWTFRKQGAVLQSLMPESHIPQ